MCMMWYKPEKNDAVSVETDYTYSKIGISSVQN